MSDQDRADAELVSAEEEGAIEVVAADAAERLAPVCAGWPAERFRRLVIDVALVRLHHGVPRVEFERLRQEWEARERALRPPDAAPQALPDAEPPADVMPPPVRLPSSSRGYPAAPDRSASAPT